MIESKLISKALFTDKSFNNLEELKDHVGIKSYASMDQTHSNKIISAKKSGNYKSDGIFTSKKNLGLIVKTADCMPIFLKDKTSIGAVHVGWKGIKNKIIINALKNFNLNELLMSVGPHAQSCCYEVKEDVSKYLYEYIDKREGKEYLHMSQSLIDLSNKIGFKIEETSLSLSVIFLIFILEKVIISDNVNARNKLNCLSNP